MTEGTIAFDLGLDRRGLFGQSSYLLPRFSQAQSPLDLCTLEWEDVSSKIAVLLYMVRSFFSGQHTMSCSNGGHPGSLVDLGLSQLFTFFEEVLESLSRFLFDGPLLGPNPRHRLVA